MPNPSPTPAPNPVPPPALAARSAASGRYDTRSAAMEVADQLAADGAQSPDLLFIFGSFHHRAAFADAAHVLRRAVNPRHVIGVTAEWVVGRKHEFEQSAGLATLALRLPGVTVTPIAFDFADGPPANWDDAALRQRFGVSDDARATFLFADPFSVQAPALLARIADILKPQTLPIMGGLASGSSQPGANVLLLDDHLSATGAVGVTLAGAVRVDPLVSPGCRPIGPTFVVTKSRGNTVLEIGGKPTLRAVQDLLERESEADRAAAREGLLIGIAIDEYRERFGRGDFLLRNVLGADLRRQALVIGDVVRPGRTVRFHLRDRQAAIEDLDLLLDREQMHEPPAAVLLATCNTRGKRLFGTPSRDASTFARRLNDPAIAGFYAAGEIGPVGNRSWLHGHAISAAIIRGV
ncbi:MAG: FIST N-terminal domain-containing protein [Phycisphaerae bacterium]|nr:FIST N-terminal domain-containing protein [Phycisphaerae bacterium]